MPGVRALENDAQRGFRYSHRRAAEQIASWLPLPGSIADGKVLHRIRLLWIGFGLWESEACRWWWEEGLKLGERLRGVDLLALSIKLPPLLSRTAGPSALPFGCLDLFLHARADLGCSSGSSLRPFPVMLSHGCRFPFTHPLPHKGLAIGFSHITTVHKQINDREIAPVVIDLKVAGAEPREQPWAGVPVPLKGEAGGDIAPASGGAGLCVCRPHPKQPLGIGGLP